MTAIGEGIVWQVVADISPSRMTVSDDLASDWRVKCERQVIRQR